MTHIFLAWTHFWRPGHTFISQETLLSTVTHFCLPGPTFSAWTLFFHPRHTEVSLESGHTLLLSWTHYWKHLCWPGQTFSRPGHTFVGLDSLLSAWTPFSQPGHTLLLSWTHYCLPRHTFVKLDTLLTS
jgi:hypothetical protein